MNPFLSSLLTNDKDLVKYSPNISQITSCSNSISFSSNQPPLFLTPRNLTHLPPISKINNTLSKYKISVTERSLSSDSKNSDIQENISEKLLSLKYLNFEEIKFLHTKSVNYQKTVPLMHIKNKEKSGIRVDKKNYESFLLKKRFLLTKTFDEEFNTGNFKCVSVNYEEKSRKNVKDLGKNEVKECLRTMRSKDIKGKLRALAAKPVSFTNIRMPRKKLRKNVL